LQSASSAHLWCACWPCNLGRPRACPVSRAPWHPCAGCAVCMQQVSAAAVAAVAASPVGAVALVGVTCAVVPACERAGIAPGARRRGVASAVSGQGALQCMRGTDACAAWRSQRSTPASARACASHVARAHVGRAQCCMEVAWQPGGSARARSANNARRSGVVRRIHAPISATRHTPHGAQCVLVRVSAWCLVCNRASHRGI
jgi:hypothetical protein